MEDIMYKELEDLVIRAKDGDIEAKGSLVEKLTPLIIKSIKRYYNRNNEFEELLQDGRLQVLECIEKYDRDRETYFAGYVQAMLKYLYLNKHKIRQIASLNVRVGEDEDDELINLIADDSNIEDMIIEEEVRQDLYSSLSLLTRRQKEVIYYFYFRKMPINDIALLLNVSYRTIVNTKVQAIEKLRKYF